MAMLDTLESAQARERICGARIRDLEGQLAACSAHIGALGPGAIVLCEAVLAGAAEMEAGAAVIDDAAPLTAAAVRGIAGRLCDAVTEFGSSLPKLPTPAEFTG